MAELSRRALGRTGLDVSVLGFGAMEIGGQPASSATDASQAGRLLNAVLDQGINYRATASDYGRSEELIGRVLAHRREEYLLASKCGCVPGAPQGAEHLHTGPNVRAGVEHSLRLLRTDYLDVVQFHRSLRPEEFDAGGALSELLALRDEGKVRYLGVSATLPNIEAQIGMGVFDVFQVPYSAMQREHEDVIRRAADAGAGVVIRGGVARAAPDDWESRSYYMVTNTTMRDTWDLARLDQLLDGMTRTAFLLRFTLSLPAMDTAIVGTSSVEHLRSNVAAAARGPLSDDVAAEVTRRLVDAGQEQARHSAGSP